jgi:hypothetical protein
VSIAKAAWRANRGVILWSFMMISFQCMLESAVVVLMYFVVKLANDYSQPDFTGEKNLSHFAYYFGAIVLFQIASNIIANFASFTIDRASLRISGSLIYMIYQKMLKISSLRPGENLEGSIINHVQIDAPKINQCVGMMVHGLYCTWLLIFGMAIGIFLYSWLFFILFGTF